MKFRNRKKFRYSIPAYTSRFRALHIRLGCLRGNRQRQVVTFKTCKKVKAKQSHNATMEAQGERRYSSYSFSTSALYGGEWSASCLVHALPPGKGPPVPIVQEAGWASEPVSTEVRGKILLPVTGIEPRWPSRPVRSQALYFNSTVLRIWKQSWSGNRLSCSVASLSIFRHETSSSPSPHHSTLLV
jgi:hypothetical protein